MSSGSAAVSRAGTTSARVASPDHGAANPASERGTPRERNVAATEAAGKIRLMAALTCVTVAGSEAPRTRDVTCPPLMWE